MTPALTKTVPPVRPGAGPRVPAALSSLAALEQGPVKAVSEESSCLWALHGVVCQDLR